ncbi:MAG TPA: serine hydrolase domain-containing protein, partial [Chitinophagaceae bacterium]|nr:serine hydrolase domain-containing protein [Chitinophagaceae bacterium]
MKKLVGILFFLSLSKLILGQLHADRIKSIIQREVANKRSKSIIVGILDPSGIQTYSAGILNDSTQQVPDGNTLYDIGSITKLFTSLLLADLSLKKKVNLDDPISKYLPKSIKSLSRNGKEI